MWRYIVNTENKYSVSEEGKVMNNRTGHILSPEIHMKGYLRVQIQKKHYYVHRLVATQYINNPLGKETVNHNDGNKMNNHYLNLSWMTKQENNQHAIDNGLSTFNFLPGSLHMNAKLTEEQVLSIRASKELYTQQQLADMNSVSILCIFNVIHNKTWKHI